MSLLEKISIRLANAFERMNAGETAYVNTERPVCLTSNSHGERLIYADHFYAWMQENIVYAYVFQEHPVAINELIVMPFSRFEKICMSKSAAVMLDFAFPKAEELSQSYVPTQPF